MEETRICNKCGNTWPIENYVFRNKAEGIRHHRCKKCQHEYTATHYKQNKDTYIKRARINTRRTIQQTRERIYEYLCAHPCVDCGESDPICLDFDHIDRTTKQFEIGKVIRLGYAWSKIATEIDKCEVRCANCHRRKTAKQFGWYRDILANDPE